MPDDASPQPVLCEIAELRQWETEARHLTDSATAFAFEWARQNGGVPTTQEAVRRFYADWRARFPQYATADDEQVMARYRAWAEEKGISTPTESDFERFCSGPDLPEHPLLDAFGRLAHRMAARLGELARAAGSFGCDGATIAALQSAGDMLENVADNRLLLSEPANWTEAHHQVHRIFQDAAIKGIPLDDAWHVSLNRLEVAAKKKLEAEATASEVPSAAPGGAGQAGAGEATSNGNGEPSAEVDDGADKPTHGPSFESICWNGERFTFNKSQSITVKLLYDNWKNGRLAVRQSAIGAALNSNAGDYRLEHTFRARGGSVHPAWGTLIVKTGTPGTYTLAKPESQQNTETRPRTRTTTRRQSGHVKCRKT